MGGGRAMICPRSWPKCLAYAVLPTDDWSTQQAKKHMMLSYVVVLIVCITAMANTSIDYPSVFLLSLVGFAAATCCMVHLCATKTLHVTCVQLYLVVLTVLIIFYDYQNLTVDGNRVWPLLIVMADLSLVCRLPNSFGIVIVSVGTLWVLLTAFEDSFRFGLYDLRQYATQSELRDQICSCSDLPCSKRAGASVQGFVVMAIVLTFDFYLTKGFQWDVKRQQKATRLAAEAAKTVAVLLANWDVEAAQGSLNDVADSLPVDFREALQTILKNLETYRDYLPQYCRLQHEEPGTPDESEPMQTYEMGSAAFHSIMTDLAPLSTIVRRPSGPPTSSSVPQRSVTLCVTNMQCTLELLAQAAFSAAHANMLTVALDVFAAKRGVVEHMAGDHLFVSFNALQSVVNHCVAGADACVSFVQRVHELRDSAVNAATASGTAYCSPRGIPGCRRFTIMGLVSNWVIALERLGRQWGLPLVVDDAVRGQLDAETHTVKLLPFKILYRDRGSAPRHLWEVFCTERRDDEWMFVASHRNEWDVYNRTLEACLMDMADYLNQTDSSDRADAASAIARYKEMSDANQIVHFVPW
ncbi:hypothetical protein DIPPA_34518 [Diplonema papillatum]|nr:hypothetical protein DIPPA_34518 [Diplonema papillatum]